MFAVVGNVTCSNRFSCLFPHICTCAAVVWWFGVGSVCVFLCVCMYMHMCVRASVYSCACVSLCVYMCVCVCVCDVCLYARVCVYGHTIGVVCGSEQAQDETVLVGDAANLAGDWPNAREGRETHFREEKRAAESELGALVPNFPRMQPVDAKRTPPSGVAESDGDVGGPHLSVSVPPPFAE